MVVYRTLIQKVGRHGRVDHLNPQTMDHEMTRGPGKAKKRGKG